MPRTNPPGSTSHVVWFGRRYTVHHYRRATITTLARGRYVTALPGDGRREHRTLRAARGHIDRWISRHGHLPVSPEGNSDNG